MNNRKLRLAKAQAKALQGQTIVAIHLRPFKTGRAPGDMTCDPVFELDDGTLVGFLVVETEVAVYGVELVITEPERLQ